MDRYLPKRIQVRCAVTDGTGEIELRGRQTFARERITLPLRAGSAAKQVDFAEVPFKVHGNCCDGGRRVTRLRGIARLRGVGRLRGVSGLGGAGHILTSGQSGDLIDNLGQGLAGLLRSPVRWIVRARGWATAPVSANRPGRPV